MGLSLQGSLLDAGPPALGELAACVQRQELSNGAWVDTAGGWLDGSDGLFADLLHDVPWQAERRQMYDRLVDTPRLLCFYGEDEPLPSAVLSQARSDLSAHYASELGEPFRTAGMCLYRDGRDSVAWHGDRIGRGRTQDTMVAIVSLGSPRVLALRPLGGRTVLRLPLGHGDLVVMGGSCQRTWEHAIPKSSRVVGPRISVQFRPRGVR